MNKLLPVASLALSALAVALVLRAPTSEATLAPIAEEAPRKDDSAELRRRVDQLEDDTRILWDRVSALERRTAPTAVATDGGGGSPALIAEVAQLRAEVHSVMTGEVLSTEAGRAAMTELVKEVETQRQLERVAQQQQRREQRSLELKAKWKDFVSSAKLTYAQEQVLNARLQIEDTLRQALTTNTTDTPREDFRKLREAQRETDQTVTALLDDAQKAQYQALRSEERGGNGGGNRPPRQP